MKKTIALLTSSLLLTACASLQQPGDKADAQAAQDQKSASAKSAANRKKAPKAKVQPQEDALPALELSEDILYKVLTAEIAFQRGQWQSAYVTMLAAAQQTRDPRLAKRAAEMAVAARQAGEALVAVRLWTELAPHSDEALQNYLGLIMLSDSVDEIEPLLTQRLADAAPQARGPMILQIQRLLSRAKDKQASFTILQNITKPYGDLMETHLALAQGAFSIGDGVQAQREARAALKIKPDSELAVLTAAQVASDNKDATKLVTDFLRKYPDAREVRVAYARSLVEQKDYKQARSQFETLLKEDGEDATTLFALGVLSAQTDQLKDAEYYLQRYLQVLSAQPEDDRDPSQALLLLSRIAEERRDLDSALRYLDQAEPGSEGYVNIQVRRAQLLARKADIEGARKALEQAQAESANDGEQLQLLLAESSLLRDANRNQEAADVLKGGLERFPNNTDLLYDYSMVLEKLGKYDEMEKSLRRVMQLAPGNQHAYNALGYSLADRNVRLPEALELIQKAADLAPEDAFIADSLGWVLFRMGRAEQAETQMRRAYGLRPDVEIGVHLGEVLWTNGKQDEARKVWREAALKEPNNEVLKSTLARLNVKL
ncbi:tetratricopeptide repeat protein [Herbaspirillum sp. AP02]|uniref:tetratricopeptide repeat protein n=1 Tax=unclassified Herbaspirillum TaxID=2624150 RepID=UPI0015DAB2E7|nr:MULTISPECIES: tetratricopeptide repeat protein [unclassified Herbaspirillum]MBG7622471.1 tetratricopeptide repeat protein [Herbaspirillum sp. AP02]NZD70159.1 tetratricopeptide repeat protein [Herbaspirillum sp. AP21]